LKKKKQKNFTHACGLDTVDDMTVSVGSLTEGHLFHRMQE
jgi:hypothetical protein